MDHLKEIDPYKSIGPDDILCSTLKEKKKKVCKIFTCIIKKFLKTTITQRVENRPHQAYI